jgi:hypothetical protein
MNIKITYDRELLEKGIKENIKALDAVRQTLGVQAEGQVVASSRKKIPSDKAKPIHGAFIANILRKKGIDPFKYPDSITKKNIAFLTKRSDVAVQNAAKTGKSQELTIKVALTIIAQALAGWARNHVTSGGLGARHATKKFSFRRWQHMVNLGRVTKRYGFPPPRGILTGRFAEGIRWMLNVGRGAPGS